MRNGKKLIRNSIERVTAAHVETKDAILWSVDLTSRRCSIKIQGTNQAIDAHFPQNWQSTPTWLKVGNAVKINFVGGIRGRVELIGHGAAIPSPVAGDTFPPAGASGDGILTGCELFALDPPAMMVGVTSGTYQINGVVYALGGLGGHVDPPAMFAVAPPMSMGDDLPMGVPLGVGVPIDAAPGSTNFRIDLLAVGADGAIDVVKGTASTSPVEPALPVDHLKLGTVLVPYGSTEITGFDVNRPFEARALTSVDLVFLPDHLTALETTAIGTATMRDQYGLPFAKVGGDWAVYFSLDLGAGELNGESSFPVVVAASGATAGITYARAGAQMADSPIVRAEVIDGISMVDGICYLQLTD